MPPRAYIHNPRKTAHITGHTCVRSNAHQCTCTHTRISTRPFLRALTTHLSIPIQTHTCANARWFVVPCMRSQQGRHRQRGRREQLRSFHCTALLRSALLLVDIFDDQFLVPPVRVLAHASNIFGIEYYPGRMCTHTTHRPTLIIHKRAAQAAHQTIQAGIVSVLDLSRYSRACFPSYCLSRLVYARVYVCAIVHVHRCFKNMLRL